MPLFARPSLAPLFFLVPATLLPGVVAGQRTDTLPAVVVTATRVPVSRAAVPASVTVLSGDALRREGITSLAEALRQVPGVTIAQSGSFGGATSLFLRGGESKYVKVLVDGVPVNDPGGAFDFATLTTDNIDRIEIVRGPASVLYGADAVTGVVQIFTRRGAGPSRMSISARGGSYGSADASAVALGALGERASYSLDLAHHETKGIYAFNNAYRNNVVSGLVTLAPDDLTRLTLTMRYSDYAYHYPTNGFGAPVDSSAVNANDLTTLGLEVARRFSPRVDAQLSVASHETSGGTNQQPDAIDSSSYVSLDHIRRRSVDARVNVRLATPVTLTVGGQLEQQDQRSESEYIGGGFQSDAVFVAARADRAIYAQLLAGAAGPLTITAGGRYDRNERFGSFGTYRAGASWRALPGTRVRASAGTGFREPTFFENYSTSFTKGNPDLHPEQSRSWEAGIEQSLLADRVTLGASYFAQRFRDLIDYTYGTSACGASFCNVASARANGQELEARARLVAGLSADASLTHLDTRVLDPGFDTSSAGLYRLGEQLIRRPRSSWSAGVAYDLPARGSVDVRFSHVGDRADRNYATYPAAPVVLPAYTRTDLGGELVVAPANAGRVGATLTLRVENALDVHYTSVYGYLTPGRTILGGARLAF